MWIDDRLGAKEQRRVEPSEVHTYDYGVVASSNGEERGSGVARTVRDPQVAIRGPEAPPHNNEAGTGD